MISAFDPQTTLSALTSLQVKVNFLYEQNESANSIEHTITDLFGTHSTNIKLPDHLLNLEMEIVEVLLANGKASGSMFSNFQLSHLSSGIQIFTVNRCYNFQAVSQITAYLLKIELLVAKFTREQQVNIYVMNEDELWNANFSPAQIDAKVDNLKNAIYKQIELAFIVPLSLWINALSDTIKTAKSLNSIRQAIRQLSEIDPDKAIRRSKVLKSYPLLRESSTQFLPLLHESLIKVRFIDENTILSDFLKIFTEDPPKLRIIWTGSIGDLKYFIRVLREKKIVREYDSEMATSALLFSIPNKDTYKVLRSGKETKASKKKDLIAHTLEHFKNSSSNS